jgi:hypothetical protein
MTNTAIDTGGNLGTAFHLAHDQIGDEVLILDMHSGNYYNLNATAAQLWNALRHTPTLAQLVDFAQRSFIGDREEIAMDVSAWACDLQHEKLVVALPETTSILHSITPAVPFVKPHTEKFTDLQDFMLMDPIHEVDADQGWPVRKAT